MKIQGSIALVTGANRGLGKAIVSALLEAGARLASTALAAVRRLGFSRVEEQQILHDNTEALFFR